MYHAGLFYEVQGNDIRMEMAFSEAGKLHQAELALERSVAHAESRIPDSGRTAAAETSDKGKINLPRSNFLCNINFRAKPMQKFKL